MDKKPLSEFDKLPRPAPLSINAKPRMSTKRNIIIGIILSILIIAIGGVVAYMMSLQPVDETSQESVRVVIDEGQTAKQIAETLYQYDLIRSTSAFELYTSLTNTKHLLQSGGFMLKKSLSMEEIVQRISSGKSDEMNITFLPGLTLEQLADPEVDGSLAQQGFSPDEIKAAFEKTYDTPITASLEPGDSLEGYIYPETYIVPADESLASVVERTLMEFSTLVRQKDLTKKIQDKGLSMREGIILASIIQKEVPDYQDQRQVAQVFLKRLKEGVVLGSDVTFKYIAEKEGRQASINDPSPYNTRRNAGLPPGPVSNFNISALEAVADPAPGDYMYFVSGDDGTNHFSRTEEEHERNVQQYCTTLCN